MEATVAVALFGATAWPVYGGGLKFRSENGDLEGEIGGRVIQHGRFFTESNPRSDTFYFKEVFLDAKGTFYKVFDYQVEGDFGGSSASLKDGWLGWKVSDLAKLQFGQFKVPVLREQVSSASAIDFPERPMIDRLAPGREMGVMVSGALMEKEAVGYAFGIVNGSGTNTSDTNDDKDLFARLSVKPFSFVGMEDWGELEMALAGQTGHQTGAPSDITSPSTGTTVLDFDSGVTQDKRRDRLNPQVFWSQGPASLSGEAVRQDFTLQKTFAGDPVPQRDGVTIDAWYVGGSYFLTGEEKHPGKLPKVRNPVSDGGRGAWEVVARYGSWNPDQKLFENLPTRGYASKPRSAGKMQEWFLGVNFYPVNQVRFTVAYVLNDFGTDIDTGVAPGDRLGDESVILTRFQIMF